ncbi:GyrI-like domain-containing protein [Arthrobacter wenxiniae]|jgi:effector-binding domain-containing protein|uniref:GyrI-like domain-containing protein n=1 Tax=Arthrobacter wenxiniae TaxID=2713570 RepID=A0A7Y7IEZ5_9MICC|nr:GyrI-like domain-containing protein [Arthrobacter wenxiniae]NVM94248.1 GyrI-like domain-containing protein [Arthrobacter wenxiniae]
MAESGLVNTSKPETTIVHTPAQRTAVVREVVPMEALREFFGRAFGAVMAATQAQNTRLAGPPFALYHGMPAQTIDVEAGFPVAGSFTATADVQASALPEAEAYEAIHRGSYDTLGTTYGAIQERMREDGCTPADTMWEYYLSDPAKQPDPATWLTRVVWPVA